MKLQNTEDNLRIVKLQFCVFFGQLKTLYYVTQTQLTDHLDHIYFTWLRSIWGIVIFWIVCDNIKGFKIEGCVVH